VLKKVVITQHEKRFDRLYAALAQLNNRQDATTARRTIPSALKVRIVRH
jgi:hypothetical protein